MRLKTTLTALTLAGMTATWAMAKTPLRDVPEIDNSMFAVGVAIEISNRCEEIQPRTVKGLAFLWDLASKARSMGYTNAEIEAYRKSDEEKARIRAMGETYMRSKGLDPAVDADLCTLGRQEMAANSQIGAFLR